MDSKEQPQVAPVWVILGPHPWIVLGTTVDYGLSWEVRAGPVGSLECPIAVTSVVLSQDAQGSSLSPSAGGWRFVLG